MSILSEYLRSQADWRDAKAVEYPDDQRNAQSAEALRSLATYIDSDEVFNNQAVAFLNGLDIGTGFANLGEKARWLVSRYGFGYKATNSMQHEEFLNELWVASLRDLYEYAAEHGEDWSEILFPSEVEAAKRGIHLPNRYWDMRKHMAEQEIEDAVAGYSV